MQSRSATLYGLTEENSSRTGNSLWGKNQFNSTFPVALCLYMRDHGIYPVAVTVADNRIVAQEGLWDMESVIGDTGSYYHFEKAFEPYGTFYRSTGDIEKIDLVVADEGLDQTPLEIKLTVVPDISTSRRREEEWAPEMVIRPVSSAHAMMGVAISLASDGKEETKRAVVNALRPAYNTVSSWDNEAEVLSSTFILRDALSNALTIAKGVESPFLIQPIWRTEGQSLKLRERCFDVFVWSDIAVMQIPVDMSESQPFGMTRHVREVARHVRALYDLLVTGDYDYGATYGGMSLGKQTDKSFALNGQMTHKYLLHPRLIEPQLTKDVLREIVLNGGEQELRPERRFDAAVVAHMMQER